MKMRCPKCFGEHEAVEYTMAGRKYQYIPCDKAKKDVLEFYPKIPSNKENNNTMKELTIYKVIVKMRYSDGPTYEVSRHFSNKQKADEFEAEQWRRIVELELRPTAYTVEREKFYFEYEE